jgi:hypothetical protein
MQALGAFRIVRRSTRRTRLEARWVGSADGLAAVSRRLMACDGIDDVSVDPNTLSIVVYHAAGFCWSSIGPAALRLDQASAGGDGAAPLPPARDIEAPDDRQPIRPLVDVAVALALELAIGRRPPAELLHEIAVGLLRAALREPRRA